EGQGERTADPLEETRGPECPDVPSERKTETGGGHQHEPGQDRALGAEPRRSEPARNRADQGARRVGGDENTRSGFREPVLMREMPDQRGQRGEEERVDRD